MDTVRVQGIGTYDHDRLREIFQWFFDDSGLLIRGRKVLLKPNLVMGKSPDKAVNTHPRFIAPLAEILCDNGCTVSIGDSPGYETPKKALRSSGIMDVVDRYDLTIAPFSGTVPLKSDGLSPYREFVFGEDPRAYDMVINLPKLKTHAMMGLTLGVKNTFGFIGGLQKGKWHLKAGKDVLLFASMLIDIHRLVNPAITILDGITAMDGDGPTSGRPRQAGLVAAASNAFVLDRAVEAFLNLPSPLPISRLALEHGLIPPFETKGTLPEPLRNFHMPRTLATDWGLPVYLKETLKKFLVKKPKVKAKGCRGCGVCADVCPAGAIQLQDGKPAFTYGSCIRCYCCHEMCPEGAIRLR